MRVVLETLAARLDGKPAAARVIGKRRRVLFNVVEYAVEQGHLAANPLPAFRWRPPKVSSAIDKRVVVNPIQARTLLAAVRERQRSGPRLVAGHIRGSGLWRECRSPG